MIVLGIDPGVQRIGYAIVESGSQGTTLRKCGILKITKKDNMVLKEAKYQVDKLINQWRPGILSIEKLYFSRNQKTAINVAQMRGIIILAALEKNIKIFEYSPNEIKFLITGYGWSDKKSVAKMVRIILGLDNKKIIDDVTDAMALALGAIQKLSLTNLKSNLYLPK